MARLNPRWNLKDRDRSIYDAASAIAFNLWRIAAEGILHLENDGFETISQSQRLDVIAEFVSFMIHIADRMVYGKMSDEQRREFITTLASHLTTTMQSNRVDANGAGQYSKPFTDLLNLRMNDYSECSYSEQGGPGFSLKRIFGQHVRDKMGAKDNKWIPDYIIDAEAPMAVEALKGVLEEMLTLESQINRKSPVPEGGVWGEG